MILLPTSGTVDGQLLGRTLDKTTASYKIVMAKAIFAQVNSGSGEFISYDSLLRVMLKIMWYPIARYRLRLGHYDDTSRYFDTVPEKILLSGSFEEAETYLIVEKNRYKSILRYPVDVFLGPWIEASGVKFPAPGNSSFRSALAVRRPSIYLPYELLEDGIKLERSFMDYIANNQSLLHGWTDMALVDYL